MDVKDIKDISPNKDAVEQLKILLEQAEKGEIRSLFYIVGYDNDSVTHGWSLDPRNTPRRLLAEMVMGQHDFVVNLEFHERDSVLCQVLDD